MIHNQTKYFVATEHAHIEAEGSEHEFDTLKEAYDCKEALESQGRQVLGVGSRFFFIDATKAEAINVLSRQVRDLSGANFGLQDRVRSLEEAIGQLAQGFSMLTAALAAKELAEHAAAQEEATKNEGESGIETFLNGLIESITAAQKEIDAKDEIRKGFIQSSETASGDATDTPAWMRHARVSTAAQWPFGVN